MITLGLLLLIGICGGAIFTYVIFGIVGMCTNLCQRFIKSFRRFQILKLFEKLTHKSRTNFLREHAFWNILKF